MKYIIEVFDKNNKISEFRLDAKSVTEARQIGRNLHILEHYKSLDSAKLPLIYTEVSEIRKVPNFEA